MDREREIGSGKKKGGMPFETHYLHISTRLSILQDSWQLQTGKLKEKIKKENSLRAGGGR